MAKSHAKVEDLTVDISIGGIAPRDGDGGRTVHGHDHCDQACDREVMVDRATASGQGTATGTGSHRQAVLTARRRLHRQI